MVEDVQRAPTLTQGHIAKPYIVVIVQTVRQRLGEELRPANPSARRLHSAGSNADDLIAGGALASGVMRIVIELASGAKPSRKPSRWPPILS